MGGCTTTGGGVVTGGGGVADGGVVAGCGFSEIGEKVDGLEAGWLVGVTPGISLKAGCFCAAEAVTAARPNIRASAQPQTWRARGAAMFPRGILDFMSGSSVDRVEGGEIVSALKTLER